MEKYPISLSLLSIFISFLLTSILIPFAVRFGKKYEVFDIPDHRKKHLKPILRTGGIAVALGTIISFLAINLQSDFNILETKMLILVLLGALLFFFLGLFDDLFSLSPILRLIIEIIISYCFVSILDINYLLKFTNLEGEVFNIVLPIFITKFILTIWLVGVTNSFNWLDGIDGLASGSSIIVSLCLGILFLSSKNIGLSSLAFCLSGSCMRFIKENLKLNKIILGDGGSHFIGFTLATLSLLTIQQNFQIENLITAVMFLSLPLFDMTRVIFSRIMQRKSPFFPDRAHIHYLLLDRGINPRRTLYILLKISLAGSFVGMSFVFMKYSTIYLILGAYLYLQTLLSFKKFNSKNIE